MIACYLFLSASFYSNSNVKKAISVKRGDSAKSMAENSSTETKTNVIPQPIGDGLGRASITLPALTESGDVILRFIIGPINEQITKEIPIKINPTICLKLSSPLVAKTGQATTVVADIRDCQSKVILSDASLNIGVTQAGTSIPSQVVGRNILFTPSACCKVTVEATSSLNGFLSDNDVIVVDVQDPQQKVDVFIEKTNIHDLTSGEINLGLQEIEIKTTFD